MCAEDQNNLERRDITIADQTVWLTFHRFIAEIDGEATDMGTWFCYFKTDGPSTDLVYGERIRDVNGVPKQFESIEQGIVEAPTLIAIR